MTESVVHKLRKLVDRAYPENDSEFSRACGYATPSGVQRLLDQDHYTKEYYSTDLLKRFIEALEGKGNPPIRREEILELGDKKLLKTSNVKSAGRMVDIIAPVQAGVWQTSFEYPMTNRRQIPLSTNLPDAEYFAVEVVGESMNLLYLPGTILVCLSPYELNGAIRDGDSVIVQRIKDGEYEATVKVLSIDATTGRAYLLPKSSHPDHQTPITIPWPFVGGRDPKTGIEKIEIIGVVIEAHKITRRTP